MRPISPASSQMLVALSRMARDRLARPSNRAERRRAEDGVVLLGRGRVYYGGTVTPKEKARRRAANKVARRSRRVNRARS